MTATPGRGPAGRITAQVCEIVSVQLGQPVAAATRLLGTPGFDSLAIADLVEHIEDALGVELAPDVLVPETFTDVAALARAVASARGGPDSGHGPAPQQTPERSGNR